MRRLDRMASADAAVAALAGVAAVAGSYAAAGFTPEFVVAPVSAAVVPLAPASIVAWSIQTLGDLGDRLVFLFALALTAGLFAAGTAVGMGIARWFARPVAGPVLAAIAGFALATGLTGATIPAVTAGLSAGVVVAVARLDAVTTTEFDAPRRRVLAAVASAAGISVVGFALGRRRAEPTGADTELSGDTEVSDTGLGGNTGLSGDTESESDTGPDAGGESGGGESESDVQSQVQAMLAEADEKSLDVDGIHGLVGSIDDFYTVDIASIPPQIQADKWALTVTGAVEEEVVFDYDDLTSRTPEHRHVTLRCVGEGLNGYKMDNAVWTGVPIMDLLDEAGLELEECCVMLRAADDFYEEFPIDALRDGFLAYGMNGQLLPRGHGHPVRALIPGHWGEINVKWLTEIEVLAEPAKGYWEKRGWHGTGPVNTVAKLHAVNHLDDGRIRVGGHAYAGTRGIRRVEVSTDGGATWTDATLSEPLPGEDVWRQWAYTYEATDPHEVVVRATDGTGTLQPSERQQQYPSGATGWVSKRVEPGG